MLVSDTELTRDFGSLTFGRFEHTYTRTIARITAITTTAIMPPMRCPVKSTKKEMTLFDTLKGYCG